MTLEINPGINHTKIRRSPISVWERAQRQQITETNERRIGFNILNTEPPDTLPQSCARRTVYRTANQGLWDVYVISSSRSLTHSLNEVSETHQAAEALVPRQKLRYPTDPTAQLHASVIDFVTTNWTILEPTIHRPNIRSFQPTCLGEVALPDHGQADIIGLCSDGTICVFEVGTLEKTTQAQKYQMGVQYLLDKEAPQIIPFVTTYKQTSEGMRLSIREMKENIDTNDYFFTD